jgi:hypothetical protein
MAEHSSGEHDVLQQLAQLQPLGADEAAVLHGALAAADPAGGPARPADFRWALEYFRQRDCPWCRLGLVRHGLDLGPAGLEVRCHREPVGRPLAAWYAGPPRATGARAWAWAWVLWVGIPLVSGGAFGWLMPLIAGIRLRRARWIAGAALFLPFFLWYLAAPTTATASSAVGTVILVQFVGSVGYGACQVRPWLAARAQPRRR